MLTPVRLYYRREALQRSHLPMVQSIMIYEHPARNANKDGAFRVDYTNRELDIFSTNNVGYVST